MAAPVAADVRLPDDSGNTGKRVRTQSRVVGANTVHEHFFIASKQAEVLGVYRLAMPQQTALAAAQNGTSTGFLWANVPAAVSNKWTRIRRATVDSQHSTVLATPTAPRLVLTRFSFTGTPSGASLTAAKVNESMPATILDLRTAVTGMTVTLSTPLGSAGLCGSMTAVGAYAPSVNDIIKPENSEDEWPVVKPGNGFVLYQDTAGTTSDTRKFNPTIVWDDIDVA
jgi:hypothetical protein